jgi:hypothetical protein
VLVSRELSEEDLNKLYGEVNSVIRTLVQSVDNDDKLCGALIIGERTERDIGTREAMGSLTLCYF